jgi:hypothetical protein
MDLRMQLRNMAQLVPSQSRFGTSEDSVGCPDVVMGAGIGEAIDEDDDEVDDKADGEGDFAALGGLVDKDAADLIFWAGPITCRNLYEMGVE